MRICLKDIQNLFPEYSALLADTHQSYSLTGWVQLHHAPKPYASWHLYVCSYEELQGIEFVHNMHILCVVAEGELREDMVDSIPAYVHILFLQCDEMAVVCRELLRYFEVIHGVGLFSAGVLDILASEGSIQEMIDYAILGFGNPAGYFDAGFNLVAANWEESEKHNLGLDIIKNRGFSEREFQMANSRNHIHRRVQKSEVPILAHNPILGVDQLLCAIDTQRDLGHLVVTAVNRPFDPFDSQLLLMLKRCIYQKLKKDEFVRNSRGYNYEAFLRDLLDEKIALGKPFLTRMNYACHDFTGNLYCIVVETARSAGMLNVYQIQELLERNLPNFRTIIHNGQIVGIWIRPEGEFLQQHHVEEVMALCRQNDIYAGMSNCFQNLVELSDYYKQSLRAIELGVAEENAPNLFCYSNYYLEHLKTLFVQKESAKTFCHPKMQVLLEYDEKNGTELAKTLYLYLVHERNIAATSAAMFMHRNSIVYRIKRIESLVGSDFEDAAERQYLMLSYRMMH